MSGQKLRTFYFSCPRCHHNRFVVVQQLGRLIFHCVKCKRNFAQKSLTRARGISALRILLDSPKN